MDPTTFPRGVEGAGVPLRCRRGRAPLRGSGRYHSRRAGGTCSASAPLPQKMAASTRQAINSAVHAPLRRGLLKWHRIDSDSARMCAPAPPGSCVGGPNVLRMRFQVRTTKWRRPGHLQFRSGGWRRRLRKARKPQCGQEVSLWPSRGFVKLHGLQRREAAQRLSPRVGLYGYTVHLNGAGGALLSGNRSTAAAAPRWAVRAASFSMELSTAPRVPAAAT